PEKAAGAELAWRRLRRDASALAAVTVERLEEAMVARRAIDIEIFVNSYRDHPLLAHVARRLVWRSEAGATFRVAEDGTLADEHDATFELGGARWVRVAHPLELEQAARERWIERFADYEILQPYPQLERPVHRASEVDLGAYAGRTFARPEELARRGYEPALGAMVKTLPWADLSFCVELIQHRPPVPSSTIARALFRSGQDEVPPEQVHPIDLSESIEDLESALRY
ncbi:MAG: DUF4132 domain-containing protein, partial [Sandaracinaceae bacterium]|nr:DUF4132 domain-containing protein [Sandaracinaceae bacterium]